MVISAAMDWLEHDVEERRALFMNHVLPHIILTNATTQMTERLQICVGVGQIEGNTRLTVRMKASFVLFGFTSNVY